MEQAFIGADFTQVIFIQLVGLKEYSFNFFLDSSRFFKKNYLKSGISDCIKIFLK